MPICLTAPSKNIAKGTGIVKTARIMGIGVGTVQKLKKKMLAQA